MWLTSPVSGKTTHESLDIEYLKPQVLLRGKRGKGFLDNKRTLWKDRVGDRGFAWFDSMRHPSRLQLSNLEAKEVKHSIFEIQHA